MKSMGLDWLMETIHDAVLKREMGKDNSGVLTAGKSSQIFSLFQGT